MEEEDNEMTSFINAREIGAKGDGTSNDTDAINSAISNCAAAGGGQVYLAPGIYVCATIHLKSNVVLFLDAGAILKGVDDPDAYTSYMPDHKKSRWHRALILINGVENAGVAGPGSIDGGHVFDPLGEEKMRGPHTILVGSSKQVCIRDVTIVNSANYHILVLSSDEVDVNNVAAYGGWDGFHIRGTEDRACRRVTVTGCRFFTGDDCIAGAWVDDMVIHNCLLNSSCNGIRWIGPGSRILISDCTIFGPGRYPHRTQDRYNSLVGIILQPSAWTPMRGELSDVTISKIAIHNVISAFMVYSKPGSSVGNVELSGIKATGVYGAPCTVESWSEDAVRAVTLRDVSVSYHYEKDSVRKDLEVTEPKTGSRVMPVWGLYARRTQKLVLEDVRFSCDAEDERPAIRNDQVGEFHHDNLRLPAWAKNMQTNSPAVK
ncbi:MAG: glycoside hydrolase [Spirochaetaceae bacterium]|nr:MAG: glycoside hydrolase [Spirochaetaceae bacterium]